MPNLGLPWALCTAGPTLGPFTQLGLKEAPAAFRGPQLKIRNCDIQTAL